VLSSREHAPLSRPARWRIASLVLVHVLIAVHIIHWRLAGTTLSSIQLSDAGRFVAEGVVTAALFLFAFLLVVTAIFGRFFCAWGCHMLALQEVCRSLLRRVGIHAVPIRSRLLRLVPLYAAFYIFVQPAVERWWRSDAPPDPTLALATDQLWATLPGPAEGFATVVGGLLMIYLLGSLSVCKYVCPYGALLAFVDGVAPGRIRLTGECDGCARCTAACTTGVLVHKEVQSLGMVAHSGCMRCFECVSACPRNVLAYRFGRPPLHAYSRAGLRRFSFSLAEEVLMLAVFGVCVLSLHGLYNLLPFVLSLVASVLAGYLSVVAVRLALRPFVALRGIPLKHAGRLSTAGLVLASVVACAFIGVAHSGFIQFHQWRASTGLSALGFPRLQGTHLTTQRQLADSVVADLTFCRRFGLLDTADWNMKLAWLGRVRGDQQMVETHLRRAITLDPTQAAAHFNLGKELLRQGRRVEAARAFDDATRLEPTLAQYRPADEGVRRASHR
jgi:polyferredoxin